MDDDSLYNFTLNLNKILIPILIIFGIIGNILNLIILNERQLRKSPCTIYFLCLSISNLFYCSVLMSYNYLVDVFHLDPASYSNIFCKIISYLLNVIPTLSVYYIVLASIDRYFSSSLNVQRRRLSNKRFSFYLIIFITVLFLLIMIGTLITFDLRDDRLGCTSRSDSLFNQIYLFIEIILYVIIAPFLLMIFGFLTIENTRKARMNRLRINWNRRTEKQLSRMLVIQVLTHLILVGPFCLMFLILIIPIEFRSTFRFYIIYTLCKIPFYCTFITPFFLYILSAEIYRQQFQKLFPNIFNIHIINQRNSVQPVNTLQIQ